MFGIAAVHRLTNAVYTGKAGGILIFPRYIRHDEDDLNE